MKCKNKAKFNSLEEANERLKEITNSSEKRDKSPQRAYKCNCGKYHLTSMDKSIADKIISAINNRVKKREESFINREAKYWLKKFGIE